MTNPEHYQMIIVELGAQGLDYTWARAFPHLTQMITTMPELVTLFSWLQREYQRRLGLFTAAEVGDIADYNQQQIRQGRPVLPLIDVVIDEMAEILRRMVDEDREYCVAAEWTQNRYIMGLIRIGQLYRKTGIITTIATQDPRATSIPRELTTQISTRISLRLQDSVQNRVVLGESSKYDASHLPGIDPITRKHTGRMVVSYAGDQYIGQAFYYTSEQVLTLRDAVIARWSAPKAGVLSEPCAIMA
jgi:DNA segregation ATPase FtsK/SpoIIIE-like protein